jgi:hypothetical protein
LTAIEMIELESQTIRLTIIRKMNKRIKSQHKRGFFIGGTNILPVKIEAKRVLGVLCLLLLAGLCIQSFYEAKNNWGEMPPTEYVIKHPANFEGKNVYVDGEVSDSINNSFYLNPVVSGLFGKLKVVTNGDNIKDKTTGVNVYGTVIGGVLYVKKIRVDVFQGFEETFLNLFGLIFFLLLSFSDWRTIKRFPFIEEAG